MLVATADDSDELVDKAVRDVLQLLRERLNMDVIFVAKFVDGQRVFRQVNSRHQPCSLTEGQGKPLEESWCQRVADGRLPEHIPQVTKLSLQDLPKLPFEIGTHLSTPDTVNRWSNLRNILLLQFWHQSNHSASRYEEP